MEANPVMANSTTSSQNLDSWRLVASQPLPSKLKVTSKKQSLKMKIVRQQVTNESHVQQGTSQEQKPSIKLIISKHKIKPSKIDKAGDHVTSQKRTPWYLLPQKAVKEEPVIQQADQPEPACKVLTTKQRVANKPKPQFWTSVREVVAELAAKRESCKKKLVDPPKTDLATSEFPAAICGKRKNVREDWEGHLNTTQTVTHVEVSHHDGGMSNDFIAAKMARERANVLFNVKGIQLDMKKKSEGFKRPTCYKRIGKMLTKNSGSDCIQPIGPKLSIVSNANGKDTLTDVKDSNALSITYEDKPDGCTLVGAMATSSKEAEDNATPSLLDRISRKMETEIQLSSNPLIKTLLEKNPATKLDTFSSLCAKFQESNESWAKCVDRLYAAFSSKGVGLPTKLCEEPKDETDTKPDFMQNILAPEDDPSHTEDPLTEAEKRANLPRTICVRLENTSKKLLLDTLMKFGTITALWIDEHCDAFVTFNVLHSAQRACAQMDGVAVPTGATMTVRMATDTDWVAILRLKCKREVQSVVHQEELQSSVWSQVAANLDEDIGHVDSRTLLAYTEDDMFI